MRAAVVLCVVTGAALWHCDSSSPDAASHAHEDGGDSGGSAGAESGGAGDSSSFDVAPSDSIESRSETELGGAVVVDASDAGATCEWRLPVAPEDSGLCVSVEVRRQEGGATEKLCSSMNLADCARCSGWFTTPNPKPGRVVLCPEACQKMASDPGARAWLVRTVCAP